jgi:hypothetical protein
VNLFLPGLYGGEGYLWSILRRGLMLMECMYVHDIYVFIRWYFGTPYLGPYFMLGLFQLCKFVNLSAHRLCQLDANVSLLHLINPHY